MEIKTLASSSQGNCTYISDGITNLLLDAGIPFKQIQRAISFRMSAISATLCTSEHGDHSKAIPDILKAGIDCYMSEGTAKALNVTGHRLHVVRSLEQFIVGTFYVMPFDVIHDTAEPLSYLLVSGNKKCLFVGETEYIKYKFRGLTHICIEANYSLDLIRDSVKSGEVERELKNRIMSNHMSLQTLIDFLKANDLSKLREVHLLHLSSSNSDAAAFKKRVEETVGVPVYIA